MSSEHDDGGNWVSLTDAEMAGPAWVITPEELDLLDLVQNFGADPDDPLSIERARGRREVERPLARERIEAAIREAEVHVRYGRRDREQRRSAGRGNTGKRRWHTQALEAILIEIDAAGATPSAAHQRLIEAYDDLDRSEDLLDAMNRATGRAVSIEKFSYEYRSTPGQEVLFQLVRDDGVAAKVTSRIWQNAIAKI